MAKDLRRSTPQLPSCRRLDHFRIDGHLDDVLRTADAQSVVFVLRTFGRECIIAERCAAGLGRDLLADDRATSFLVSIMRIHTGVGGSSGSGRPPLLHAMVIRLESASDHSTERDQGACRILCRLPRYRGLPRGIVASRMPCTALLHSKCSTRAYKNLERV